MGIGDPPIQVGNLFPSLSSQTEIDSIYNRYNLRRRWLMLFVECIKVESFHYMYVPRIELTILNGKKLEMERLFLVNQY